MKYEDDIEELLNFMLDCNPLSVLEGVVTYIQNEVRVHGRLLNDDYYIIYEDGKYRTLLVEIFEEMYEPVKS